MRKLFLILTLTCIFFSALARQNKNLYRMNISNTDLTVSGISAGAFFAIQMGVIYSSVIKGVGSFAGGPYYCAQDQEMLAFMDCMYDTMPLDTSSLESYASNCASSGLIDNTSNLQPQNVWIFSGTLDTVVNQKSSVAIAEFYQNFGASPVSVLDVQAEHSWVTNNYGNQCSQLGSPYINDCPSLNAIQEMLTTIYSGLKTLSPPVSQIDANLFTFDQTSYGSSAISFASQGYVYIPTQCSSGKRCSLHIAFHGCQMQSAQIGETFVINSELNGYAEANGIVIIYPQLIASYYSPSNPQACFDWWGYTGAQFATNQGKQPSAIRNMIKTVAGF